MVHKINHIIIMNPNEILPPNEIWYHIFLYLPIKDLIFSSRVSTEWNGIVKDVIKYKVDQITPEMLARLVKDNHPFLNLIQEKLTRRQKKYLFAFYAFMGNREKINQYLSGGFQWDYRSINYLIIGNRDYQKILDEYSIQLPTENIHFIYTKLNAIYYHNDLKENQCKHHQRINELCNSYPKISFWLSSCCHQYFKYGNIWNLAVSQNNHTIIEYLKKKKVPINDSVISYLINVRKYDLLMWMISNYPVDQSAVTYELIETGHLVLIQNLVSYCREEELDWPFMLSEAIRNCHIHIVSWMIEKGIKPNSFHILNAVAVGNMYLINEFIKQGYQCTDLYDLKDETIDLYLKTAITNGHSDTVLFLLRHITDLKNQCLTYAIQSDRIDLVKHILNNSITKIDLCWHTAVVHNKIKILCYLKSIDSEFVRNKWIDLMQLAIVNNCLKAVKWLISMYYQDEIKISSFLEYYHYEINHDEFCYMSGRTHKFFGTNIPSLTSYHHFIKTIKN